jgi:hypothetical protein
MKDLKNAGIDKWHNINTFNLEKTKGQMKFRFKYFICP